MAFKLIEAAQGHWRAVNAPHLVALVRAGASGDLPVQMTTQRYAISTHMLICTAHSWLTIKGDVE
jgi:Cu/Zn superoxide dismutase